MWDNPAIYTAPDEPSMCLYFKNICCNEPSDEKRVLPVEHVHRTNGVGDDLNMNQA